MGAFVVDVAADGTTVGSPVAVGGGTDSFGVRDALGVLAALLGDGELVGVLAAGELGTGVAVSSPSTCGSPFVERVSRSAATTMAATAATAATATRTRPLDAAVARGCGRVSLICPIPPDSCAGKPYRSSQPVSQFSVHPHRRLAKSAADDQVWVTIVTKVTA
jgi:hypothetical protein